MLNLRTMFKMAAGAASIAAVLSVAGCSSPLNTDRTEFRDAGEGFPALSSNQEYGGRFVDPNNILRIREGQTKQQVRALLGNPQFHEGFFNVTEWNYVFNLYTGKPGGDYRTCQYQVKFDDHMQLESTRWRDAQCPAILVPVKQQGQTVELSGDVLFDFDSAQLTLEGRRALDQVVASVRDTSPVPNILIVGYTDHLGKKAYNQTLSLSRANAVRDYFVANGIERAHIRTEGAGESSPVVECTDMTSKQQERDCLRPNRRVVITLGGEGV